MYKEYLEHQDTNLMPGGIDGCSGEEENPALPSTAERKSELDT
jgi:hypothetical protein